MKKITKIILITAATVFVILAVFIGSFIYNTRFKTQPIDTSVSPDGEYTLLLSSVGEPDFPFGSAYGRITLSKGGSTLSETDIDLAQDGGQIVSENWSVEWKEDCARVTLKAEEQADEIWEMYFDGRVEQLPVKH